MFRFTYFNSGTPAGGVFCRSLLGRTSSSKAKSGFYHTWSRCVRRAYLCGEDPVTGRDLSYRKDWIVARLKLFARCFAVDVCDYSIMSNHLHLVLRTRPDLVDTWSDVEVARRWWTLFPKRKNEDGTAKVPKPKELEVLMADADALAEKRRRLSSLSWFMGRLKEWVARRANKEDESSGRFWEGRFKCQALVDDAAVLACSMYVDLNPIRAGLAETPEESEYTSAKDRIDGRNRRKRTARNKKPRGKKRGKDTRAADDWLCPILSEVEIRASREREQERSKGRDRNQSRAKSTQTVILSDTHASAATPSPSFLPMRVDRLPPTPRLDRPSNPRRQTRCHPRTSRPHPRPPHADRRYATGGDRPLRKILPTLRRSGRESRRQGCRGRQTLVPGRNRLPRDVRLTPPGHGSGGVI